MELRVLQYFLAVAREESITGAAEALHLSQPTLSRQLRDLERELGKPLFTRGSRRIALTEEGMILRKRAEEIMALVRKAEQEISLSGEGLAGDISIAAGETRGVRYIARFVKRIRDDYPLVHMHITSGSNSFVLEQLDRGLADIGVMFGAVTEPRYDVITLPFQERWGVLMRRDVPLAEKEAVTPEDLWQLPLILSQEEIQGGFLPGWMRRDLEELNIAGSYSLLYNASLMVEAGLGYAVCFLDLLDVPEGGALCVRPLSPEVRTNMNVVRKKYQMMSKASEWLWSALGGIQ